MPKPSEKIRPFDASARGWFRIHNYVFDVCMPRLSHAGWRVLCVAIRKTWGYRDPNSDDPRDRKQWDQISYSQFIEASGLASPASVAKGIKENMKAGYILRREVGRHKGTKRPLFVYGLNREFEDTWPTTTISVATEECPGMSASENEVGTASKSEEGTASKSEQTKQQGKSKSKDDDNDPCLDALLAYEVDAVVAERIATSRTLAQVEEAQARVERRGKRIKDPVEYFVKLCLADDPLTPGADRWRGSTAKGRNNGDGRGEDPFCPVCKQYPCWCDGNPFEDKEEECTRQSSLA